MGEAVAGRNGPSWLAPVARSIIQVLVVSVIVWAVGLLLIPGQIQQLRTELQNHKEIAGERYADMRADIEVHRLQNARQHEKDVEELSRRIGELEREGGSVPMSTQTRIRFQADEQRFDRIEDRLDRLERKTFGAETAPPLPAGPARIGLGGG